MKWLVRLEGDPFDLKELSRTLNSYELTIEMDNGSFILKSTKFNDLSDATEVRNKAEEILILINGSAKLLIGTSKPIEIADIILIKDNKKTFFEKITDKIGLRDNVVIVLKSANGTQKSIYQTEPVERWVQIGINDLKVAKALRLFIREGDSWGGLYKIYEVIKSDVNDFTKLGAENDQIGLFRRTANSEKALGDEARHGHDNNTPPPNPMKFYEAKALIETVLKNWLKLKEK